MNDRTGTIATAEGGNHNARYTGSVLVRIAFLVVAVADVVVLFWTVQGDEARKNQDEINVLCAGVLVASIAMVVPWQRFQVFRSRLDDPGPNLGLFSKLLGWFSVGLFALALLTKSTIWGSLLFFISIISLGLWTRRSWVVWVWYIAPFLLVLYATQNVLLALIVLFGPHSPTSYDIGGAVGSLTFSPFWAFLAVRLWRELREWHRHVRSARASPVKS